MRKCVTQRRIGGDRTANRFCQGREGETWQVPAFVTPPLDLSAWVSRETLLDWIREELASVEHEQLASRSTLFMLLSFAYAIGLFDSDEVARACHADPFLAQLCTNERNVPWAQEVREFRRKNRGALIPILKRLLIRAAEEHFGLETGDLPEHWEHQLEEEAIERLDISRHMDVSMT